MSDMILGYDCQGEALRAGDRVVIVYTFPWAKQFEGAETTVLGLFDETGYALKVDIRPPGFREDARGGCRPQSLRRISSGRDLFNQCRDRALSEGSPDARTEPTTTERAQAWISGQPWTEPS